jgi:uncharacterized protein YndB with AHSA1/START domain
MQTQDRFEAHNSVIIHAPIAKVWAALTTPDLIKQWLFGVDTETDWKPGSPLVHKGMWQGKPYEDKGTILKIEPPHLLAHNHWSALSGLPDRPEHYQQVTYALAERGGDTELTIHEVNIPGEEARALSEKSWKMALQSLKELLEK